MKKEMPPVTGTTKVFGCIAHPTDHVRAPMVFNPMFAARGLDHVMVPVNAPPESLEKIVTGLRSMPNFGGMAVTIPHKIPLLALCDSVGPAAQIAGAVNAVRFDSNGSIHGDNFDGAGFVAGVKRQGHSIAGKSVLIVGAGGAARAIAVALCEAGVTALTICNRTKANADAVIDDLHTIGGFTQGSAVAAHDGAGVDIIINTTSLGLHDGDQLPLALDAVDAQTLIADIIMVPERTAWLAAAEDRGLATHYGRHMLDCQIELIGEFIGAF